MKGKSRLQTGSPGSESCSGTHNPEVAGSNPAPATNSPWLPARETFWRRSSGVEQGTHKPRVSGSNPLVATIPHFRRSPHPVSVFVCLTHAHIFRLCDWQAAYHIKARSTPPASFDANRDANALRRYEPFAFVVLCGMLRVNEYSAYPTEGGFLYDD